ncbi:MAG: hypothetical protein V3U71_02410 [Cocleimonas sp.]
MIKLNTIENQLKIIFLLSLINSSVFTAFHSSGGLRLVIAILMNISGVMLITYFFKRIQRNLNISLYFKIILTLLVLWSFYTVFRSIVFNGPSLITLFGHHFMGWAWLAPLAIVFGLNVKNWINLFDFFSLLLLLASIAAFGVLFYSNAIFFAILEWMAFLPIMMLAYSFQSKKNKKILLFAIPAFLILTYFASLRVNIALSFFIIIFLGLEYFRSSTTNLYKKVSILVTITIIGLLVLLQDFPAKSFDIENKEIATDTRSFLFEELYADMSDHDLLIGRGTLGTYHSPYFEYTKEHGLSGDSPTRTSIEVGYLQIIFKGGYIMLALYLLLLLPAAYLGIFKSNNIISRMSGYLVLAYLLLWSISYYPVYSPKFILLWMAAGTAISRTTRSLSNQDLLSIKNEIYETR